MPNFNAVASGQLNHTLKRRCSTRSTTAVEFAHQQWTELVLSTEVRAVHWLPQGLAWREYCVFTLSSEDAATAVMGYPSECRAAQKSLHILPDPQIPHRTDDAISTRFHHH